MECRLCTFLVLVFIIFFSNTAYAQECGDEEYVNWMGEVIKEKKQELGGIASLIPTSLALGQAILETGYGRSFAAKKRNNHFGLSRKGKLIKFVSVSESVHFYLETLQDHNAYRVFRKFLMKGVTDSYKLLRFLAPMYAEDTGYHRKVSEIIQSCDLKKFDDLNT